MWRVWKEWASERVSEWGHFLTPASWSSCILPGRGREGPPGYPHRPVRPRIYAGKIKTGVGGAGCAPAALGSEWKVPFYLLNRSRWMGRISKITAPNWRWWFKMHWSVTGCFQWCCRQRRSQATFNTREGAGGAEPVLQLGLASFGMEKQPAVLLGSGSIASFGGHRFLQVPLAKRMLTWPALLFLPCHLGSSRGLATALLQNRMGLAEMGGVKVLWQQLEKWWQWERSAA